MKRGRRALRCVAAGTAGTATMTLAYAAERRLRPGSERPLDYDDSSVPGEIAAALLGLRSLSAREERQLGLLLRWTYGPAFGLVHGALGRVTRQPWTSLALGGTLMTVVGTLFPVLGGTPPPWAWPADVVATSVGTHAAYVVAVAAVHGRAWPQAVPV